MGLLSYWIKRIDRVGGVLLIFVLPPLLALGCWQLDRAEQKRALNLVQIQAEQEGIYDLVDLLEDSNPHNKTLKLRGYYDNQHLWFLDNRILNRQVGFDVISPFYTEDAKVVLVNRGFLPTTSRRDLPKIMPVLESVELIGRVYQQQDKPFLLATDKQNANWPKMIQAVDMKLMLQSLTASVDAARAARSVFAHIVRLNPDQIGSYPSSWRQQVDWLSVERHLGYALTWFSLAAILFITTIMRLIMPLK